MIQVTGNEYISLPFINEKTGNINYLTLLNMTNRGMLELRGNPLIMSNIYINDELIDVSDKLSWDRISYWIPVCLYEDEKLKIETIYLTPPNQKAFAIRIKITNKSDDSINLNSRLILDWSKTYHVVNESYEIKTQIIKKDSNWNHGTILQQFNATPLISLATMEDGEYSCNLNKGETNIYDFFVGIGYEEVSAATAAKHLKRVGFNNLFNELNSFLENKIIKVEDSYLSKILNTNLFFSYYYSSGKTLDTEELVLVTSRSPRYYVSAAYWDRDSLLWSFPSFLLIDYKFSKEVLKYVFTKQINNIGEHSRFIDGTLLEPGFELDELCAPVLALDNYIETTKDFSLLNKDYIKDGLYIILNKLKSKRHDKIPLYETFLMPTDDVAKEKYLTYDNVLVWKVLNILSKYLNDESLYMEAEHVKKAIYEYFVVDEMFVFSSDLNNNFSIYDEPPGSLLLFEHLGFCNKSSKIWINTVNHIRSKDYKLSFANSNISEIGCEHAPHPWILSLSNSLLCGYGDSAIKNLKKMTMDNYIACESVDEETGLCATGEAFATCAGFLAYSLNKYLNN